LRFIGRKKENRLTWANETMKEVSKSFVVLLSRVQLKELLRMTAKERRNPRVASIATDHQRLFNAPISPVCCTDESH
jgi:hypothetical protein